MKKRNPTYGLQMQKEAEENPLLTHARPTPKASLRQGAGIDTTRTQISRIDSGQRPSTSTVIECRRKWLQTRARQTAQACDDPILMVNKEKKAASDRRYRQANRQKIAATSRRWNQANPEKNAERKRRWYQANKEKCAVKSRRWYQANKEKCAEVNRRWRQSNKEKRAVADRRRHKIRYATDPNFRLLRSYRKRIWAALQGKSKFQKTVEVIGCTISQLRLWLVQQFLPGMSWDNYGDWHVDHIRPCSSFDLSDPAQQKECFHYTNLQPLWATDNLRKGSKAALDK